MTSKPFDFTKPPIREEGMPVWEQGPKTPAEEIEMLNQQVAHLQRFRYVGRRLRQIAKEGNLMINHPTQGFVLVEDLEQYMLEKL